MAGFLRALVERSFKQSPALHAALPLPGCHKSPSFVRRDADASDLVDLEHDGAPAPASDSRDDVMQPAGLSRASVGTERHFTPLTASVQEEEAPPRARAADRTASSAQAASPGETRRASTSVTPRLTSVLDAAVPRATNAAHADWDHADTKETSARRPRLEPRTDVRRPFKEGDTNTRDAVQPAADRNNLPDVHIHIGRIELTAVTAPSSAPKAPRGKPPMSLDEYLDRRGRKPR
jgi:hypothetical protein